MACTAEWLPRFDVWATEPVPRVDQALVHKARPENVLVARVEPVFEHHVAAQMVVPEEHPFFFEHPCDHVPGLALVEAGRQGALVVAHTVYDVPIEGIAFLLQDLRIGFQRPAELDQPVFGRCELTDLEFRRGRLVGMTCAGHYLQSGEVVGSLSGRWSLLPEAVVQRMRRR